MNYVGIVQARYESDEFQGKSLAPLDGGVTVLEFLLERVKGLPFCKEFILATTALEEDNVLAGIAERMGVKVYRGKDRDVLGRIYEAVKSFQPDGVIRILGNSPLVDIAAMEKLVAKHNAGKYDYAYNEHVDGVIYGMGCSVFSFDTLKKLVESGGLSPEQKEIGSLYIRQYPEKFMVFKQKPGFTRAGYRVNVDRPKDVELVKAIIKSAPDVTNENVGRFLDENPLLTDYQKSSGVSETGLEKMFLFPDKIGRYHNGNMDLTYPISVELSLTNKCNFNCAWCSDSDLRERLGGEFTAGELKGIFEDLAGGGTKGIVIEGGGEPAIHADFDEIIKAANNTGLSIGLITNGSISIKKDHIPYFDWIRISLDAATPKQHEKNKKVKVFEKVMNNIRFIGENKVSTTLGVGYVVTNGNVENLENLLLRLRLYNVDYIQFRPVIDHPELASTTDISYLKKYETSSFKVDIEAMNANLEKGNGGKPCMAHSLSAVITADGGAYLCGRLNIYDWVKPIGNLHEKSFKETWEGEERQRQMKEVASPNFCLEHCPECRMTKYNMLIDRVKSFKTKSFI